MGDTNTDSKTRPIPASLGLLSDQSRKLKSFSGCFTCRSRKIKCDLKKPHCSTCNKAGLICSGYDIKLKWSSPIQFKEKNGNHVSRLAEFKAASSGDEKFASSAFFQRRNVGFVIWDAKHNLHPYETYEDIDADLNSLQAKCSRLIGQSNKTQFEGPFGVFSSKLSLLRKRKISYCPATKKVQKLASLYDHSSLKSDTDTLVDTVPQAFDTISTFGTLKNPIESTPNDQLWLSKELRDDALLTAAALNGDTQFLNFSAFSFGHSDFGDNTTALRESDSGTIGSTKSLEPNQNDFLNLVFHRNNALVMTPSYDQVLAGQSPVHKSNAVNEAPPYSDTLSNPRNQHLYYSNYNNYYYSNPYQLNNKLDIVLHASDLAGNEDEQVDFVDGDSTNVTSMPSSIIRIVQDSIETKVDFELCVPIDAASSPAMGIPACALQVQPLTRYLLNYYVTQVADLMTVIPLTENPWKTIYFPRALMAIGELLALGKTSTAKNALFNGLLAVSAFNIQSKFPKHSDSMKFYLNLGIRLRNQASVFVKHLLHSNSPTKSGVEHCVLSEKYKDVLCAIMTMISVDLVWGTMQDINFYIKWCGRVIRAKMLHKKKLSSKARVLHRVFLSLNLIQASTCLDFESIRIEFEQNLNNYDLNGDMYFGNPSSSNIKSPGLEDALSTSNSNITNASPAFVDKKLINATKHDEKFATDALYGLPNSLIMLFSATVELLRTKIYHKEKYLEQKDDFSAKVNELNKRLINWKLEWNLYQEQPLNHDMETLEVDADLHNVDQLVFDAFIETEQGSEKYFLSPMHEAIYHHILSFYHALTIYFNRFIKEISAEKLQLKVAKTLFHLNAIQKLIADKEAAMIPLFWQGFISGCEAISVDLQAGFKKWGADIAQYLGSYWGARQIMLEVWRRKRSNEARDTWVHVIHDWEMNLMLN